MSVPPLLRDSPALLLFGDCRRSAAISRRGRWWHAGTFANQNYELSSAKGESITQLISLLKNLRSGCFAEGVCPFTSSSVFIGFASESSLALLEAAVRGAEDTSCLIRV